MFFFDQLYYQFHGLYTMVLLYHYLDRDFGCIIITSVMVISQSDYFALCSMASSRKTWMNEQLLAALQELHTTKSSLQSVVAAYGIPNRAHSQTMPPEKSRLEASKVLQLS